MFVYNLTTKVNKEISGDWIKWQKEEYMPQIMATNLFTECKFFELIEADEMDSLTFVQQYFTDSKEKYDKYIALYSEVLRKKCFIKWKDNFISFKTFMKTVH